MDPLPIPTPDGVFLAWYSERGLSRLDFPRSGRPPNRPGGKPSPTVATWHRLTTRAVNAVLAGREPGSLPPLDLAAGSPFQQAVWRALCRIAPGTTQSYGEVARSVGAPGAARAVGQACGANPIPLLVPCHRVLAAGGKLGGFGGGLDWKRRLLAHEHAWPTPGTEP